MKLTLFQILRESFNIFFYAEVEDIRVSSIDEYFIVPMPSLDYDHMSGQDLNRLKLLGW